MKYGFRKPSIKKSIAARTTGKAKRNLKKAIFPAYGNKGMGIFHPIRTSYNKLYKQTTFGINNKNKMMNIQIILKKQNNTLNLMELRL